MPMHNSPGQPAVPTQPDPATDNADADVNDESSSGNRFTRLLKSLLRIGLLSYALVIILMVAFEPNLVYPGAYMTVPAINVTGVTTVNYLSADGTKLTGRLFEMPADDDADAEAAGRPTVLFFHGNGVTAGYESGFIAQLGRQLGANVLAAEYRGYDSLSGTPNEPGVIADAMAARDFVCQQYQVQPSSLILIGQSLGGGCAVAVAADSGAKLLVLDRTFDRMVDVAADRYWYIPVRWLMRNRYDSLSRIQNYNGPLLQVHGTTDNLVPIAHGRRLHQAAPTSDKQMIEVEGMGHNDRMPARTWRDLVTQIQKVASS